MQTDDTFCTTSRSDALIYIGFHSVDEVWDIVSKLLL